jgi:hypothetical protein
MPQDPAAKETKLTLYVFAYQIVTLNIHKEY